MKISRFNDAQIMGILAQAENGVPVTERCRDHGMSSTSFYKWRVKYGGMDASMVSQMKGMDDENKRLKKLFAELSMQNDLLKEAMKPSQRKEMALCAVHRLGGQCCFGMPHVFNQRDLLSLCL